MIAICGGIGSGKSVVSRILRQKGYGVFDCDYEARILMEGSPALRSALEEIAGSGIYDGSGRLRRQKLASILFSDSNLRGRVNRAVHSAVTQEIKDWLEEDESHLFVETAIAAESGIGEMAAEIWMVEAPSEDRIQRVARRDGRSTGQIVGIMEAQKEEERKLLSLGVEIKRIDNSPDGRLLSRLGTLLEGMLKSENKTNKII